MDEIFAMIMKEAESSEGHDLHWNIYAVFMEIGTWVLRTMAYIHNREREVSTHED